MVACLHVLDWVAKERRGREKGTAMVSLGSHCRRWVDVWVVVWCVQGQGWRRQGGVRGQGQRPDRHLR